MFVPFVTSHPESKHLERRKGGGGGGKTSGGGGSSSKSGGGSTSSSGKTSSGTTGKTSTVPLSTSTASGKGSATAYGSGGGSATTIPAGQIFAGRSAGGGTRSQVFGTRTYGSGYPGIAGRGVAGRGFPFWFWPVVWVNAPNGSYLQNSEYGNPYNTSRVGGPMAEATFASNSTNTTFHVLSDNSTVSSLITSISRQLSKSPQVYNASAPGAPQPEQAIQYYRASSIVLTLNGYNNSATLSSNANATDSPLPSGTDTTLLNCLNQTIGLSAPLVSGASLRWSTGPSSTPLFGLLCLVWWILALR
ncbi:hypothetical protein HD554DRAFT_2072225 [Boletus coccyginus]|nr:hypothetical protein HD554DRAFT_2072225 [Boletus coccyginus]